MRPGLFTVVAALLALTACSRPDTDPRSQVLKKVRVSFSPLLSWGPLMIAQAEGFFEEEGIQVEFVPSLASEEELVALVTGDIDVDPGPLHAGFFSAISHGAKVRLVAGQGYLASDGCTYYGIVRRPAFDSLSPDIKRIRASQDGVTRFATLRMLNKQGVDVRRLEMMRLPDAVLAGSLRSGAIDAAAASEPALTRLKRVGPLWLSAQVALPDLQWGVIAFSERLLYRERETGERFLRAYSRGVAQYRQGKTDRNVAIISEATSEPPEIIREACWLPFREDSRINWSSIAEFQEWARSEGFLERTLSADQAWDSTSLNVAVPPIVTGPDS